MVKSCAALLFVFVALLTTSPASAAIVAGEPWTETSWVSIPSSQVTGMAWAPDGSGRLFVTQKGGTVQIVDYGPPPSLVATPFSTDTVFTSSECGLIGIAFDPNFMTNGYVYLFLTVASNQQQVIRYTASGNVGINRTVIMPGLPTNGANHDGGAVLVGRDGKLYWAIGDLGSGVGVDLNLTSLASKVGRANRDGTIPADNPFIDGGGPNNDYIYARGFRNPYTSTFQPANGRLWVDVAGTGYEQIFATDTREHAGYNDFENNQPAPGPPNFYITPKIKYRTNGTDTRTIAAGGAVRSGNVVTFTTTVNHLFRQGEKFAIAGVTDPSFNGTFYVASAPHIGTTFTVAQTGPDASSGGGSATTQNQGGAVTGGTFYDATGAPPSYHGNFFYGDFNSGRIMRAVVGPGTTVTQVDYFATGNTNSIDVAVGPDGALYYVGFAGTIKRATYNATSQDIVVSPSHVWMDEGGKAVFMVRLATAPAGSVTVDVTHAGGSSNINVLSGGSLTFTPANFATPQAVTIQADFDSGTDAANFSVSSTGLTTQTVVVNAVNGPIFAYESPGSVPDGAMRPGVPLTVNKNASNPADLDLDWDPSCGAAWDYSVHEGTIGSWYDHNQVLCTTEGATAATLTPGADSHYYLVAPLDITREGSYGTDSDGTERPASTNRCRSTSDTTTCP